MNKELADRLYVYDPISGVLFHTGAVNLRLKGKAVGTKDSKGYLITKYQGKLYKVHRIIWLINYGEFPSGMIDHKNKNKSDNRLQNLRDVCAKTNQQNIITPQSNNKTGFLGVSPLRGKYLASIWNNGVKERIGVFLTPSLAYAAYMKRKKEIHEGFIE